METSEKNSPAIPPQRDYSTISPSAKVLLWMKGLTDIPFAREAATLLNFPQTDVSDRDFRFWGRVLHFEARYKSIDSVLAQLPVKNILELSSGFSFRSLQAVKDREVYYIDTDLPDVIRDKKEFTEKLKSESFTPKGTLEMLPLNALDEQQVHEVVSHFPPGEIAIVNEGLLMYLDPEEKERLCRTIHSILEERGGYWVTADIYIKQDAATNEITKNDPLNTFLQSHKVEEKKFDNFNAAAAFFTKAGFVIDHDIEPDKLRLSAMSHFLKTIPPDTLEAVRNMPKIRKTWCLRVAGS